jgi:hypothetical protein
MHTIPAPRLNFDATMVGQLACPACQGDLSLEEAGLRCTSCGRVYPIVNGVPVLIAERAEPALDRDRPA